MFCFMLCLVFYFVFLEGTLKLAVSEQNLWSRWGKINTQRRRHGAENASPVLQPEWVRHWLKCDIIARWKESSRMAGGRGSYGGIIPAAGSRQAVWDSIAGAARDMRKATWMGSGWGDATPAPREEKKEQWVNKTGPQVWGWVIVHTSNLIVL